MPLVEVQAFRGGIEYAYECEECGRKMNITLSDD
jgi:predicted nucleic acid-binding Zn ribbon protein